MDTTQATSSWFCDDFTSTHGGWGWCQTLGGYVNGFSGGYCLCFRRRMMSKVIKKLDEIDYGTQEILNALVADKIELDAQKKMLEERISAANTSLLAILQSVDADKVEGLGWNVSQVSGSNAYLDPEKVKTSLLGAGWDADRVMELIDGCTRRSSYIYPSVKKVKVK
jgi:hypothetical protein